jgi:hypothetical protein
MLHAVDLLGKQLRELLCRGEVRLNAMAYFHSRCSIPIPIASWLLASHARCALLWKHLACRASRKTYSAADRGLSHLHTIGFPTPRPENSRQLARCSRGTRGRTFSPPAAIISELRVLDAPRFPEIGNSALRCRLCRSATLPRFPLFFVELPVCRPSPNHSKRITREPTKLTINSTLPARNY